MNKAGIYCMFSVVIVFLIVISGLFLFRQSSPVLTAQGIAAISPQSTETTGVRSMTNGKLNINTATTEDLEMLPGIGKVLAKRIVAYRENYGLFESIDELLQVKGIGPNKLNDIRSYITID